MQKILVTGGNKGIGKAICQLLLEEYPGVHVILGSRDEGRGLEAKQDIVKMIGDDAVKNRIDVVTLDTTSDESVKAAASKVGDSLYGIINNAGIMRRDNVKESNNTNYFGPRRVNDAFLPKLEKPGGRIVNIASAAGPIFVSKCSDQDLVQKLSQPWTIEGGIPELDDIAKDESKCSSGGGDAYGFSKALVSAYTWLLAKEHPDLIIHSVTPGFINTDMTAGRGASNPPSKGAQPPVWLCMSDDLNNVPTGRYYGSDCKRSPLDQYRGPGDPEHQGPDGK